ncbi:hypothetical protein [Dongia sp.]|uniref:hypothetical protein n=1 Tax=Dongia sp. TaxID=1977262 RepID=UPI003753D53D
MSQQPYMKIYLGIAAVIVIAIGIGVYQFAFMHVPAGMVSTKEMTKSCEDQAFRKEAAVTDPEAARMKVVCECMMEANAAALKEGVTVVEWMAEAQKNATACMAKAGISTE